MKLMTILFLMALLVVGGIAQAQSSDNPYFFLYDHTLWRWTQAEGAQPVSEHLPETESHSLSPDQQWFVYRVLSDRAMKTIAEECPCGGGDFPDDLWLMNTTSGSTERIAGPPPEATKTSEEISRSNPVWSPDSQQLAWIQGGDGGNLVIYDLISGITTVSPQELPPQNLASSTPELGEWTEMGILYYVYDYDDHFIPTHLVFTLFNSDGLMKAEFITDVSSHQDIRVFTEGSVGSIALFTAEKWMRLNPQYESIQPFTGGTFVRYAPGKWDTSLWVYPSVQDENGERTSEIHAPDDTLLTTIPDEFPYVSASGQEIIYNIRSDGFSVWRRPTDGGEFTVDMPSPPDFLLAPNQSRTFAHPHPPLA